jgi:geranylgeranyl reductase family protein
MWDLVVVGAGPAGTTAALAARRADPSASVLLLDKSEFPRSKACGDAVAASAADLLTDLGADASAVFSGSVRHQTLELRGPGDVTFDRPLSRAPLVLRRRIFDARMLDLALESGAEFLCGRVYRIRRVFDHVVVNDDIPAKVVIAADGAESVGRKEIGAGSGGKPMAIALRGYASANGTLAARHTIAMTARAWPSYAWAFPLGHGVVNVGYGELLTSGAPLSKAGMLSELHRLIPGLPEEIAELRAARLPVSSGVPRVPPGRLLLAGDALSLVNPLTGEGIYHAMVSGALAGRAALAGAGAGAEYRRLLRARLGRNLRHLHLLTRLESAPRMLDLVLRRAAHSQRVFDGLADLGLHDGTITGRLVMDLCGRTRTP